MKEEKGSLLFLYTETPLHAGSGAALGVIDLPIQRERMTGHPLVQGSGIKGALREAFSPRGPLQTDKPMWLQLFGPELDDTRKIEDDTRTIDDAKQEAREDFAGAISVQDARVLLLPIRSLWSGFAWVTCPLVLERLARDMAGLGLGSPAWHEPLQQAAKELGSDHVVVGENASVVGRGFVVLEGHEYPAKPNKAFVDALATWLAAQAIPKGGPKDEYQYFRNGLTKRLVLLNDTEFGHWANAGMEVVTRIAIDPQTGTVKKGALWSEECLPAESVLWAPMYFSDGKKPREDKTRAPEFSADKLLEYVEKHLQGKRIRLGGDRTVGRGIVATRVMAKGGA